MTLKCLPLALLGLAFLSPVRAAPAEQADKVAARYGVGEAEVLALRRRGLGWGEIDHALVIAKRSGQPVSTIMALRDEGLGWGQIAKKYGFSLGEKDDLRDAAKSKGKR